MELFKNHPNPMLFPSVIVEVMQHLGLRELKRCRLVCRDWNAQAHRVMKGKTSIAITNYIKAKDYTNLLENRKDFCDTFVLSSSINIETPVTSRFFATFGYSIKSLSLQKAKWKDSQLADLIFQKLPNLERLILDCVIPKSNNKGTYLYQEDELGKRRLLPKLKYLSVNASAWDNVDVHPSGTIKIFLLELFTIAPMLEKISCPKTETNYHPLEFLFPLDHQHISTFINGEVVDALDELNGMGFEANIRRVLFDNLVSTELRIPKLNSLNEIDINMTLRDEHVRKLINRAYALETFEAILTQSVTVANLHSLITSASSTLTELKLRFLRRSTCCLTFPSAIILKQLKNLTLTGFRGSFAFIRYLVNLESLIIIKIPLLSRAFPPLEMNFPEPLRKLKTFEIYEEEQFGAPTIRVAFIQTFPQIFPNLLRLRMDHLCDASLTAIYQAVPNLQELVAKNGKFTDDGIIGTSRICRIVKTTTERNKKSSKSGLSQSQFSSISDLKALKLLDLHSKELSNLGLMSGIIHCTQLKSLTLMSYRITDTAIIEVVDALNLEYLKTEFCNQLTTDVVDYVNEKLNGFDISINEYEGPMKAMDMWKFLKRNNNLRIPVAKMSKTEIDKTKRDLRKKEPEASTSKGAASSSRR